MVPIRIEKRDRLTPDCVRAVSRLVDEVTAYDGVRPLSEHVMLHLRHGGDTPARNFIVWEGAEVVGYGHLDPTDTVSGASAEVAIGPRSRGHGYGRALVETIRADAGSGSRLRLWAHGQSPGAERLAQSLGFTRGRVLWQMRRSLFSPVPKPEWPDGVTLRTFVVGQDEEEWLAVNNRAFEQHPDQGGWTLDDVTMREQEPWFDPEGFFLAEKDGRIVGFHWTKIHGATPNRDATHGHDHEPIGEVYVVGIDPSMQGQKLGPALTLRGLEHLRDHGLGQVMLYVDETNTNAIRTYERLGFVKWDVDVSYVEPAN